MILCPAVDLSDGKCVRLRQGDYDRLTVFSDDPVEVARRWEREGGDLLHIVDLDGAKAGRPINVDVIRKMVDAVSIPCQLGGGIRDEAAVDAALALGVDRVIIGTRAVRDPDWFERIALSRPGKLALGLDAKSGYVAVEGWLETSKIKAVDLLDRFESSPIAAIIYTDVAKDGMMSGPNTAMTAELTERSRHLVVASGGISKPADVDDLAVAGVKACVLGRSLYEGAVSLRDLADRFKKTR
jgi:phosphoribosylformimino-5-aminoimidazole carboxamide ribotide isomerase